MIKLRELHPLLSSWTDDHAFHLDVRGLLADGGEPYVYIMDCVNQLGAQDTLVIHALFDPKPLIAQLTRMGLSALSARLDEDHWALTVTAGP